MTSVILYIVAAIAMIFVAIFIVRDKSGERDWKWLKVSFAVAAVSASLAIIIDIS